MATKKEYITPINFRRRLSIAPATFKQAVDEGRIKTRKVKGSTLIEWNSNSLAFIKSAPNPERYTEGAIVKRKVEAIRKAEKAGKKGGRNKGLTPEQEELKYSTPSIQKKLKAALDPGAEVQAPQDDPELQKEMEGNKNKREAEAEKQKWLAKQARLKYLRDAGAVIDIETVKKDWEKIGLYLRKSFLEVPDRTAELFASLNSSKQIKDILLKEITHILTGLNYEVEKKEGPEIQGQEIPDLAA